MILHLLTLAHIIHGQPKNIGALHRTLSVQTMQPAQATLQVRQADVYRLQGANYSPQKQMR